MWRWFAWFVVDRENGSIKSLSDRLPSPCLAAILRICTVQLFPGWKDWIITEIRVSKHLSRRVMTSERNAVISNLDMWVNKGVCLNSSRWTLHASPLFLYLLRSLLHTCTNLSPHTAPPNTSVHFLLFSEAGCVFSTVSHFFFTPLPTTSDEIPPARPLLPLAHSASWCNLSSRPVRWCRILPKPDEEIPHSWSVHHLFCLYPKGFSFNSLLLSVCSAFLSLHRENHT